MTGPRPVSGGVMRCFPPHPGDRVAPDQVYSSPAATSWFMHHVREVARTAVVAGGGSRATALPMATRRIDDLPVGHAGGQSMTFAQMLAHTSTDGVLVLQDGHVVAERYRGALTPETPHLCHSITKSLGACAAAWLIEDGVLDLGEPVTTYVPELGESAYRGACVRHLLDMTVDIRYTEDHEDDASEDARLDRLCGVKPSRAPDEPGSVYDFATTTVGAGRHGETFHYVSLNSDVLGWVMERAGGVAVPSLLSQRVWSRLSAEDDAYIALDGAGSAQLDGGFCSSLRDLARFGQMLLQGGALNGCRVVPSWFVDETLEGGDRAAFTAAPDTGDLPPGGSYRNCFWVFDRGDHTTIMGLGMYGQVLYINPEADVVVAKFSSQPRPTDDGLVTLTFNALEKLAATLAEESAGTKLGPPARHDRAHTEEATTR